MLVVGILGIGVDNSSSWTRWGGFVAVEGIVGGWFLENSSSGRGWRSLVAVEGIVTVDK